MVVSSCQSPYSNHIRDILERLGLSVDVCYSQWILRRTDFSMMIVERALNLLL